MRGSDTLGMGMDWGGDKLFPRALGRMDSSGPLEPAQPFSRPGPQSGVSRVWVLGLLGLAGSAGCLGRVVYGYGTSTGSNCFLLSCWRSHPCRPVFPEWSQVLGLGLPGLSTRGISPQYFSSHSANNDPDSQHGIALPGDPALIFHVNSPGLALLCLLL